MILWSRLMSNKDVQRLTKCVSDIGQTDSRRSALSDHCCSITPKVKVTSQCSLSNCLHDDEHPAENLLRLKGFDRSAEIIELYEGITRLMSLALQNDLRLENFGDRLAGAQFVPWSPVVGKARSNIVRVCRS